jgi:hypothetical protein
MVLVIAGHPRSGTTLLRHLCNSHPVIYLTHEFGNFHRLGTSRAVYTKALLRRLWTRGMLGNRAVLLSLTNKLSWKVAKLAEVYPFVVRYLLALRRSGDGVVDSSVIEGVLQSIFVDARVVGDKLPGYVFELDNLANDVNLRRLVIYRDCRDVVSSNLVHARTVWRRKSWVNEVDTAEKLARRWVSAIELMERHREKLHVVRYEELVRRPGPMLTAIGEWLEVDPAGFATQMIRTNRIGKHGGRLTEEELVAVKRIAGPTMTRLGYGT